MGIPEETGQVAQEQVVRPTSRSGCDSDADQQREESGRNGDLERIASTATLRNLESNWRGWISVLGSFLFLVPSFGFMSSLGTVQTYLSINQLHEFSTGEVGWISSVYLFLSLLLNIFVGPIFDIYGPLVLAPLGAVGVIAMYLIMAECKTYLQFMLCLGVFGSIGSAVTMVVAVSAVGKIFVKRRGLAMGLALTGSSIGQVIYPVILKSTFPALGWKWSMRILALMAAGAMVPGVLCFVPYIRHSPSRSSQQRPKGSVLTLRAFKNPAFNLVTAGMFTLEFIIFGSGALLPTIATGAGFSPENAFVLLSIIGATSTFGRVIPGMVGDRLGHFNVILFMMTFTIISMGTIFVPFVSSAPLLYAFSALWGFGSGSFLSVTPVCIGKTCDAKEYGTFYGTMNLVVSVSLLISLPLSGIMLDNMGGQALAGLYIAILFLAAVCFFAARALLIGQWFSLKTII
ncbi:major facilitator superfamily domain-containing protein [Mariannaea sp. PMI_226]|nr:major facilitator superfamily domain-containing protein [Mariannaea sp. PMI_226]